MPMYDYVCAACGPFTAHRPMSEYDQPLACEGCGAPAPRAILRAPALATMDAGARRGMAVNERSRHEPRKSGKAHPSGCGCCSTSRGFSATPVAGRSAAKSFPSARPWMISH
jgi:putative FmdB family regulatory protein